MQSSPGLRGGSGLRSPLVAHMLLVDVEDSDALHDAWHLGGVNWLASHPSLEERIARIYGQEQDALPLQEGEQRWVNPFAAALPLAEMADRLRELSFRVKPATSASAPAVVSGDLLLFD